LNKRNGVNTVKYRFIILKQVKFILQIEKYKNTGGSWKLCRSIQWFYIVSPMGETLWLMKMLHATYKFFNFLWTVNMLTS